MKTLTALLVACIFLTAASAAAESPQAAAAAAAQVKAIKQEGNLLPPWAVAPAADKDPANPDAAAGAAAGVGEKEGAKVAKALQGLLPPGTKITRTAADSPVDGWFSDSGPGYLIEGVAADGKTFHIFLVARDWIGIRQFNADRPVSEGTLVDKKCKAILEVYNPEAYRAAYKALMNLGMSTPSLVNSGWWEATKIFEGRMDQVDRIARDLMDRHCKTDAERDEAALSLVELGVPARGAFTERALKGKGLAKNWCIGALGYFADKEAARVLAQVLNDPATPSISQRDAATGLAKIGEAETGPALMAAFGRTTDGAVSQSVGEALARIHYTDAAPKILEQMNSVKDQRGKADYAKQLARLGYAKAIPDIEKLCKVKDFTAEWALDSGDRNYADSLLEMSYLRLTGPWGKPVDGVRLLLLGPAKAAPAGPVKLALLVENAGDKVLNIIPYLSGNLFVNDVPHDVAPGMWDGLCTLQVGEVWIWPYDLSRMIAGPGSYKVRYEVGDAKSGTIYDLSRMIAGPGSYKVRYEVGHAKSGTITVDVGPAAAKPQAEDKGAPAAVAPAPSPATAAAVQAENVKEFVYKKTPQGELKILVHLPPDWKASDKRPVIVFFFGGGWTGGTIEQFHPQATYLASRGMVTARADYRVKSRQGTTPRECVEDAKSAVRWLRQKAGELGIDPGKVIAAGGSAGGHIAACTALVEGLDAKDEDKSVSSKPEALVLFNPVVDLTNLGTAAGKASLPPNQEAAKEISPILYLKKDCAPCILFYGTTDRFFAQGQAFLAKAKEVGARVELYSADGMPHGFFNKPPWTKITVRQADEFLAGLGYLKGDPTIKPPAGATQTLKKES